MRLYRTNLHPDTHAGMPGIRFLLTLVVLVSVTAAPALLTGLTAGAQQPNGATYEDEIQTGRNFMRQRKYEDALKAFKRANDLKGKTSAEAYLAMANAYMGLEAFKNVAQSADKVVEFAANNPELQAQAYNLKAIAIQRQSDGGKDQKKLQEAETVFRQAVTAKADYAESRYNLGVVLLQQNRDPEGIAELRKYLELAPDQFFSADARKIIENPRRAREPFAPDFSITTSEGEYISLDDLKGKVVLLDFWGTWCPPCVASLPALRTLNKKFTKSEKFVLLGISSDGDEDKWSNFIVKQEMVWPQFLDRQRAVQRAFRVSAFPTYIVLDHEGVIRFRTSGSSFEREAELSHAIEKQIKILQKAAPSN
ncbi:MAG TPA: redoxin domain-containing protein [Pyrinomonadaceae bacterium]